MADNRDAKDGASPEFSNNLGLAGGLAKTFINSPLSPLLLIACLALGLMGLVLTPRQEDPQISVPMVDIFFSYHGASADQVASLATDPLERMMSEIAGVKHVYSMSQRNGAMVTVQFEVGEELGPSLVKLNDKIQSNLDRIPPGVSQPLIRPKGIDNVPVVTLTMWSHEVDEASMRTLGLDVMQRLKEIGGTSQSFIVGGRSNAYNIEVFPERLAGFGIGLDQLAQTIRTANSERGVGNVETGQTTFSLYTGAFLQSVQDIENLMIGDSQGQAVYIRDVALVTQGTDDANTMVAYYTGPSYGVHAEEGEAITDTRAPIGAPAVTIAVAKKAGSNGVQVTKDVLEYIERLKGSLIPDNIHVEVTRDYGETANEKVNELIFKLFVVTGAVTLLIWYALGLRAAIVVLIVIPVVILLTVFGAYLLGFTIDRVSLFALIFSIGILVDDAIVVVENIYRRWLMKGECSDQCNVDAVREVGNPTILATFTVIAALLPMGFVTGMMGPYMAPIPALGSVAMLISLFAAFIFTPWLAQRIKPTMKQLDKLQKAEHRQERKLNHFFKGMLLPLLDSRLKGWIFGIGLLFVFALSLSMFGTQSVAVKMLPNDNKPEFNVVLNMPEGTALPVTANVVARLAEELMDIPEVVALQSYTGTASPFNFNGLVRHTYLRDRPWQADIQVQLTDKGDRERSSHALAVLARNALTPIAAAAGGNLEVVEMPPGPPVLQTMVAEIYGPDGATRRQVARDVEAMFAKAETIVDSDTFLHAPYDSWRFVVNREKASRRGVSVENINRQLEMAMGGMILGDVKNERALEPEYIYLQMPLALRGDFGRLGQLPIPTASGTMIPLTELGYFEAFQLDPPVYHKDLRAVEYVTGEVAGQLGAPIYGILEVEGLLEDYIAPDGVAVDTNFTGPPKNSLQSALEWTGEWTVTYVTFRDMGIAFGVALILIYILVVWEFGNFTMPAIVMAPIPLTLIGIVPGHWLFDAPFTATSMIGFIALAGIIVRNSILLVDFSRHAVEDGMEVRDAVVYACCTRTRPIIITALALMAGSSVILSDPIFEGMAISLMMGGMVSTLLTLIVIPLGCVTFRKALTDNGDGSPDTDATVAATETAAPAYRPHGGGSLPKSRAFLGGIMDAILMLGEGLWLLISGGVQWFIGLFGSKPRTVSVMAAPQTAAPRPAPVISAPAKVQKPAAVKPAAVKPASVKPAAVKPAAKAAAKPKAKPAPKPKAKPASKAAAKPKVKAAPKSAAKAAKPTKPPKPKAAKASGRRGIRLKKPGSTASE
ncbi:MAG: efflux RND transporter permease subunit [Rhodobacterales bacterium]|nr:efflux RND transporter permease subunit [Rhodobacterales bacterium]